MDKGKQQAITAAILARVAAGSTPQQALDEVLGAGSYERLAGVLYDRYRARSQEVSS